MNAPAVDAKPRDCGSPTFATKVEDVPLKVLGRHDTTRVERPGMNAGRVVRESVLMRGNERLGIERGLVAGSMVVSDANNRVLQ